LGGCVVGCCFGMVLLSSCKFTPPERTESSFETYNLSPSERTELEARAIQNNDSNAAFRLMMYYQVTGNDEAATMKWVQVAAKNGNPAAIAWLEKQKGDKNSESAQPRQTNESEKDEARKAGGEAAKQSPEDPY